VARTGLKASLDEAYWLKTVTPSSRLKNHKGRAAGVRESWEGEKITGEYGFVRGLGFRADRKASSSLKDGGIEESGSRMRTQAGGTNRNYPYLPLWETTTTHT